MNCFDDFSLPEFIDTFPREGYTNTIAKSFMGLAVRMLVNMELCWSVDLLHGITVRHPHLVWFNINQYHISPSFGWVSIPWQGMVQRLSTLGSIILRAICRTKHVRQYVVPFCHWPDCFVEGVNLIVVDRFERRAGLLSSMMTCVKISIE